MWKHEDKEYIAVFKKGLIDESSEVTIRFENGSIYKGFLKNSKPEGKGFYVDEDGIGRKVIYKDGVIERDDSDDDEGKQS